MEILRDYNFLIWAAQHYEEFHTTCDFLEDIKRIKYIKKALTKYKNSGEIKERYILNHLIVLNNVFGPENTCKILFLKMTDHIDCLKPFLVYLNMLPDNIYGLEYPIDTTTIKMDQNIVEILRGMRRG